MCRWASWHAADWCTTLWQRSAFTSWLLRRFLPAAARQQWQAAAVSAPAVRAPAVPAPAICTAAIPSTAVNPAVCAVATWKWLGAGAARNTAMASTNNGFFQIGRKLFATRVLSFLVQDLLQYLMQSQSRLVTGSGHWAWFGQILAYTMWLSILHNCVLQ